MSPRAVAEREPPAWMTDTGRHYVRNILHDEVLAVVQARVPKWTAGSAIAAVVGALAIVAAVGAAAVAMERTKEVPGLLRTTTVLETKIGGIEKSLDRLEHHFGTKP
jgi:hypothetical protein